MMTKQSEEIEGEGKIKLKGKGKQGTWIKVPISWRPGDIEGYEDKGTSKDRKRKNTDIDSGNKKGGKQKKNKIEKITCQKKKPKGTSLLVIAAIKTGWEAILLGLLEELPEDEVHRADHKPPRATPHAHHDMPADTSADAAHHKDDDDALIHHCCRI